ncbi:MULTISPECIES: FkbM family methyltransferase [unclassified Roseateles]|uniref:FkbM family methyltransferase n=1 Tax=unclassified Roseateles TaxID=2626991 RepID=UPI00070171AB|nr:MULTISPECIES: FkbM family methyltransferase [unclassified Roseateles]KQW41108.1 hypothetical protein ASC81_22780 [Pelomonas sp. Root405]KRA67880.1 hypothetical protein ASD88_20765 [Pelomonas sp. Root662]
MKEDSKIENPWIAAECVRLGLAPNRLKTFLQEQYGQLGEDLIVEGLLKAAFATRGLALSAVRYLEVGANHPVQTSNSYLLARKWGGSGVLVEANPALIDDLQRARPQDKVLHRAVVPDPGLTQVTLNVAQNTELSSVDLGHLRSFGQLAAVDTTVNVAAITLDRILAEHFDSAPHLLSIDIEGIDLAVLAACAFERRPWLVITEPSRHYHHDAETGFLQVMQSKRYVEVARTDYNLIFADRGVFDLLQTQAAAPGVRRSFDIFDTLIARRCIRPEGVFAEVERRSGHAGFTAARLWAERTVAEQEYQLADIHALVAQALRLDAAQAQALMQLEVDVELANVVPVADAIAQVQDDSLLITDMYLPEPVIRQLLGRAGLPGHLTLLRSAAGKRSGKVWAALKSGGEALSHLGDNPTADVQQPQAHGMQARLTTQALPTPTEAALLAAGLPRLAETLRVARLGTARGALPDDLVRLQSELNLPVLMVSALHLLATAGELPQLRLLFSARDARYLQTVYDALAAVLPGRHPSSHYWYSSRLARTSGDAGYHAYCKELIGPAAWLVDLCGTGASVLALRERLGLSPEQAQLFVCEFIDSPEQIQSLMQRYGLRDWQPPAALWTDKILVPNEVLELLNYVPEGMVSGVRAVPGGVVPVREPMAYAPATLVGVQAQRDYIHAFVQHFARADGAALLEEFQRAGPQACASLSGVAAALMPQMSRVMAAWLPDHRRAEQALMARLGGG